MCSTLCGVLSGGAVQLWNVLIIVIDALYTALWVPVVATFELPHRVTTASGATDFCVGLVLCIDIYVRFHAPILLTSTYKSLTLSTPRSIAAFYLVRGSFFLDAAAAIPLVFLPFLSNSSEFVIIILVLRILRLARVKRVIDMLFYIQMMSISGASSVRMVIGSLVGILYTIAVMCNLLACIWYWIGRQSPPDVGWLSQEYSARPAPALARCLRARTCGVQRVGGLTGARACRVPGRAAAGQVRRVPRRAAPRWRRRG